MFFEVGLIVLLPLIFSVAQRLRESGKASGSPYVLLSVPTIAVLSTLHGMLPPHPGPLVGVTTLHANLGLTMVLGLVCAIPTVVLAGPVYARWLAPRLAIEPDPALVAQFTKETRDDRPVPLTSALVAVVIPVLLMLLRTIAELVFPDGNGVRTALTFLGEPIMAMLAGLLFACAVFGFRRGVPGEELRRSLGESLKSVAGILLIIGGGGAFNEILEDSGIGKAITTAASGIHLNVLILAWLLALLLSTSTGSATVGIVASTGVVAPLAASIGTMNTSLLVVAIGAGSLGLNYVNHAGFWLTKESFGMTLGQATRTQTVVQTLVSVLGLGMTLLLSLLA